MQQPGNAGKVLVLFGKTCPHRLFQPAVQTGQTFRPQDEQVGRIVLAQAVANPVQLLLCPGNAALHGSLEGETQLIDPQHQPVQWMRHGFQPLSGQDQPVPAAVDPGLYEALQTQALPGQTAAQFGRA